MSLSCRYWLPVALHLRRPILSITKTGTTVTTVRSVSTPWKHSPGDRNATGIPAEIELQPGDVLRFKGGVRYFGEIEVRTSGAEGQPIVLDGNLDGRYGNGPAILDGAQMIDTWQPVTSPDQVAGNPKWQEIMYADVDMDLTSNFSQDRFILHRDKNPQRQAPWQRIFLVDGERRVLPIAMMPKPSDPFYPDLPADFYDSPIRVGSTYPHKVYYEEGSRGNSSLPLIAITYGGNAPVVQPVNGGNRGRRDGFARNDCRDRLSSAPPPLRARTRLY